MSAAGPHSHFLLGSAGGALELPLAKRLKYRAVSVLETVSTIFGRGCLALGSASLHIYGASKHRLLSQIALRAFVKFTKLSIFLLKFATACVQRRCVYLEVQTAAERVRQVPSEIVDSIPEFGGITAVSDISENIGSGFNGAHNSCAGLDDGHDFSPSLESRNSSLAAAGEGNQSSPNAVASVK